MSLEPIFWYYFFFFVLLASALGFVIVPLWRPMRGRRAVLFCFSLLFSAAVVGIYSQVGAKSKLNDSFAIAKINGALHNISQQSTITRENVIQNLLLLEPKLPTSPYPWMRMGMAYSRIGAYEEAKHAFQMAYQTTEDEELRQLLRPMAFGSPRA